MESKHMKYNKNEGVICFENKELTDLLKSSKVVELLEELSSRELSLTLQEDRKGILDVVDTMSERTARHRDDHEIVTVLSLLDFYGADSEIHFEIDRNFDPKRNRITTLAELNTWREGSDSDFMIAGAGGGREVFQLKRYRGSLTPAKLNTSIRDILKSYGNRLQGKTLLILVQSGDNTFSSNCFSDTHDLLRDLQLDGLGYVRFLINEQCKFSVIQEVYPMFQKFVVPWRPFSSIVAA